MTDATVSRARPRAEAAFFYYAALDRREYGAVARKYGVSEGAVRKWSKRFRWGPRLQDLDRKVAARLAARLTADLVQRKARQLKLVDAYYAKVEALLRDRKARTTMSEFLLVAKHELVLVGEASERSDATLNLQEWLRRRPAGGSE